MPRVQGNGVRVHYESAGAGAPVVCLVHGTGGTAASGRASWKDWPTWAHVIAPDLPGHGQSGGAPAPRHPECVAFVAGSFDALSVRRVVWAGTRWGRCRSGVRAHVPERVDGLILVGTGARLRVLPRLLGCWQPITQG